MKKVAQAIPNQLLRSERIQRGWSQQYVADQIGAVPLDISRWERGVTLPRPHFREALSRLYNKSLQALGLGSKEVNDQSELHIAQSFTNQFSASPFHGEFLFDPTIPLLPSGTDRLVGRDDLLESLKQRLYTERNAALSALNGLPGVGKTAIAVQLAHDKEIQEEFSDGVLWVGLGPNPNILGHLSRWGDLLSITSAGIDTSELSNEEDWGKALRKVIGTRHMLLVIDDVWTLKDVITLRNVGGLNCAHLITTRFPGIAIRIANNDPTTVHELRDEDSLKLLAEFIPEVVEKERDEVLKLVHHVGGLPLALILLGKYLKVEAYGGQYRRLRSALEQLQDPKERLGLEQLDMLHGTLLSLQKVIAISDQHIDIPAQSALRALSIFPAKPNTFSEEAALAICTTSVKALHALIDAGLLEVSGLDRYTLHQTIADYARLHRVDTIVEERMVAFFVSYTETNSTDNNALELEINNVLTSLHLAFERGMSDVLVRSADAFAPFLEARGLYDIALEMLQRAQQAALLSRDDSGLARMLLRLGRIAERRGDLPQAEQWYQEGYQVAERIGHRELISDLLANWGEVALNLGDYSRAKQYVQKGLDIARQLGDQRRICSLLRTLGEIVDCHGQFEQGDKLYQEALTVAQKIGDQKVISILMQDIGTKVFKRGSYKLANEYFQKGLTQARQIGDQQRVSALLSNMGMIEIKQKQYVQAERFCQESLSIARTINHPVRMGNVLQNLGILEGVRGNYERGAQYLQESVDVARSIGHQWLISEGLCEMGELHLKWRKFEAAFADFKEAYAIAQIRDIKELMAYALYGLARIAENQKDFVRAKQYGKESLEIFEAEGHIMVSEVSSWLKTLNQ